MYWAVLLFAAATALTHVGIGKEMVLVAFGITFGGVVLALALAFGLGGRGLAREILERRLRRASRPPQERITPPLSRPAPGRETERHPTSATSVRGPYQRSRGNST